MSVLPVLSTGYVPINHHGNAAVSRSRIVSADKRITEADDNEAVDETLGNDGSQIMLSVFST